MGNIIFDKGAELVEAQRELHTLVEFTLSKRYARYSFLQKELYQDRILATEDKVARLRAEVDTLVLGS